MKTQKYLAGIQFDVRIEPTYTPEKITHFAITNSAPFTFTLEKILIDPTIKVGFGKISDIQIRNMSILVSEFDMFFFQRIKLPSIDIPRHEPVSIRGNLSELFWSSRLHITNTLAICMVGYTTDV